jgi:cell division protein FtsB
MYAARTGYRQAEMAELERLRNENTELKARIAALEKKLKERT